jgi:hypothetical protein
MTVMPAPLESNYLVPNATFLLALVVLIAVLGLVVGGLVWFLTRRRRTAGER